MAPTLKRKKGNGGPRVAREAKKRRTAIIGFDKEVSSFDELKWKEVQFPNQFEDAEGFFGLEEISDVEITKDQSLEKVQYKVARTRNAEPDHGTKETTKNQRKGAMVEEIRSAHDEEWGGIESDASKQQVDGLLKAKTPPKTSESKSVKETKKKQPKVKAIVGPSNENFDTLRNLTDDSADVSQWQDLELSEETLSALSRMQYMKPTPIQRATIPEIVSGHDLIGKASTGSGKTLAFGIPILESWLASKTNLRKSASGNSKSDARPLTALIISPTRELAHQISAHMMDLCSMVDSPSIATLTGGLSIHKQQRLLTHADIIICTPGRLWEMMSASNEFVNSLRSVRFFVLDEADRLLSEGHFKDLAEILNALDRRSANKDDEAEAADGRPLKHHRQTLVFSATFQKDLQQKLSGRSKQTANDLMSQRESMEYLLKKLNFREEKLKYIDINPVSQMAENLAEGIVECGGLEKDLYLYTLLIHHIRARTMVFVNSITSVRRLTPFLQNLGLQAHALHSQMPQKARLRSIERFSSSSAPSFILIATDVAARGLDIPSVQLILHYHVPRAADVYVHRSGRTARAGNSGSSILLCAPEEVQGVRRLVAKVHARTADSDSKKHFIRTIEIDRRVTSRVKGRVSLSKKIADSSLAKEKHGHEDNWLKTAAEDLGVEYDSDEFAASQGTQKGRGQGRKKKEKAARSLSKDELSALRAQLREELGNRVNVGVSERYLTAGGIDVDSLLGEKEQGQFLGKIDLDDFGT